MARGAHSWECMHRSAGPPMLHTNQEPCRPGVAALCVLGSLLTGCQSSSVRSVVDVVPEGLSHSLEVVHFTEPIVRLTDSDDAPGDAPKGSSLKELHDPHFLDLEVMLRSSTAQFDPELGPMDFGFPLLIDLGAGEAPYDDGVRPLFYADVGRSGFSDTVIRASWRESISTATMLHATVAMSRLQDLGLLEGASEMRFSFFVLGWKTSL